MEWAGGRGAVSVVLGCGWVVAVESACGGVSWGVSVEVVEFVWMGVICWRGVEGSSCVCMAFVKSVWVRVGTVSCVEGSCVAPALVDSGGIGAADSVCIGDSSCI